jgi:poly(hydroxyalkanoate) granule-associated protein
MATKEKKTNNEQSVIDSLSGKAREVWLAGLGALASVEEEGNKVFNKLVEKGTDFEKRGKEQIEEVYTGITDKYKEVETKVKSKFSKAETEIDENLQELVHKMGVPTKEEISELTAQVEKLVKKVDTLSRKVDEKEKKASK